MVALSVADISFSTTTTAAFVLPSLDCAAAYRHELGITDGAVVALYSGSRVWRSLRMWHGGVWAAQRRVTLALTRLTVREQLGAAGFLYAQAHLAATRCYNGLRRSCWPWLGRRGV